MSKESDCWRYDYSFTSKHYIYMYSLKQPKDPFLRLYVDAFPP